MLDSKVAKSSALHAVKPDLYFNIPYIHQSLPVVIPECRFGGVNLKGTNPLKKKKTLHVTNI